MHSTFNDSVPFFLLQLFVIVLVGPLAGKVAVRIGQPRPVGWIAAGLCLGPSILGNISPKAFQWLFRPAEAGLTSVAVGEALGLELALVSEFGLLLLLFQMGAQFEFSHLKPQKDLGSKTCLGTLAISVGGIACPFGLTFLFGRTLYDLAHAETSYIGFTLFNGIAMSITALPILAFMMKEMGIERTRLGAIIITAGAIDDAKGWIGLAVIAGVVRAMFDLWVFMPKIFFLFFVYLPTMLWIVGPWIRRRLTCVLAEHNGTLPRDELAFLIAGVVLSGLITQLLGIFAIFGAFLMGAIISPVPGVRREIDKHLDGIVTGLFLPVFFTSTGLRTDISGLNTMDGFLLLLMVLTIAVMGKFGGCYLTARFVGFSHRESACIGIMMNCRALMELVALNVGHELGVIPRNVFTAMVIMALVTTAMTTPLLRRFANRTELEKYIGTKRLVPDTMLAASPNPVS